VFNLSGSEIVFLLLAGLVVLGPERLPGVIRTVGKVYGDIRRAARGLEKELSDTFREPINEFKNVQKDLTVRFGEVDTEPSPPMRPEQATPVVPTQDTASPPLDTATSSDDDPTGSQ
jgi:sec-independent protein translocase protein TatB